jgi:hypothetical protein
MAKISARVRPAPAGPHADEHRVSARAASPVERAAVLLDEACRLARLAEDLTPGRGDPAAAIDDLAGDVAAAVWWLDHDRPVGDERRDAVLEALDDLAWAAGEVVATGAAWALVDAREAAADAVRALREIVEALR